MTGHLKPLSLAIHVALVAVLATTTFERFVHDGFWAALAPVLVYAGMIVLMTALRGRAEAETIAPGGNGEPPAPVPEQDVRSYGRPRLPNFDPAFCLRITKWGAATCLAWLTIAICILVFVDPANSRCPGWIIYAKKSGQATSLWLLVIMFAAVPTIWICQIVLRWKHYVQRYYDRATAPDLRSRGLRWANPDPLTFPHNRVLVMTVVGWSLFCTAPLWFMFTNCATLP